MKFLAKPLLGSRGLKRVSTESTKASVEEITSGEKRVLDGVHERH